MRLVPNHDHRQGIYYFTLLVQRKFCAPDFLYIQISISYMFVCYRFKCISIVDTNIIEFFYGKIDHFISSRIIESMR